MNNLFYLPFIINLQLFAEGGEGTGTSDGGTNGVTEGVPSLPKKADKNPLANVKYGIQEESIDSVAPSKETMSTETVDRNAEFEKLIREDYKDLYDAKVKDTVQKRLKSSKETVDKFNSLAPVLELIGNKYGVDATDIEALTRAVEEDNSYYEDEAIEKGMSVEELKAIKKLERENINLKRQMEAQRADENAKRIYSEWMNQAEQARIKYPSLDLNVEIQNPQFASLLKSGIDVATAFEVIHKDEITPALMQYTAKTVEQKLANNMAANASRPMENGLNSQSSAIVKNDVSHLTKEDRAEIIRRVARGEKIRF